MRVRDYLRVPYLLRSRAVHVPDRGWLRTVSHPELPGCAAEAETLEDALRELDRQRVATILRLLAEGERPPVPRPPLGDLDGSADPDGPVLPSAAVLDLHETAYAEARRSEDASR